MQCFNVSPLIRCIWVCVIYPLSRCSPSRPSSRSHVSDKGFYCVMAYRVVGYSRQGHHRKQVQLLRDHCRRMSWHVYYLYSTASRRLRRVIPSITALLVDFRRIWMSLASLGINSCLASPQVHPRCKSQRRTSLIRLPHTHTTNDIHPFCR